MSKNSTATMSDQVVPVVEADSAADGTELVRRDERGMVSAEWAVGIIAAVAIAGVLLAIITNGQVEAGAAQVHPDGDQLVLRLPRK